MIIVLLTILTLVAFAANSLLCRWALHGGLIDAVSFTVIRLTSGAVALLPLARLMSGTESSTQTSGSWGSGLALLTYALAFSLAYLSLSTGTGALLLFGAVQVTMIGTAIKSGERLNLAQWVGSLAALVGLVYLVSPGISAPSPLGAALMCLAGVAWGLYSLRGRGAAAPVAMTAGNFLRAAPLAMIAGVIAITTLQAQLEGILLAILSGAVMSGLGYVLWYTVLRSISTTQASVVQLLVPVLAAFGGVVVLSEEVSFRLMTASALILGGVLLAVIKPKRA